MSKLSVFSFCGSPRQDSVTQKAVVTLVDLLKSDLPILHTYMETPRSTRIKGCQGCQMCFEQGGCPQTDDMHTIKDKMLNSQIILLSSPVYFHNVTGATKDFLDRVSFFSHTFELRGKIGITLNTSASNGNDHVAKYLNKVLSSMGCAVVCDISITKQGLTDSGFESILTIDKRQIVRSISRQVYPISAEQEIIYRNYCDLYHRRSMTQYELAYWDSHHLDTYTSFQKLFLAHVDNNLAEIKSI